MTAHYVDVPVTDLDEHDDDIIAGDNGAASDVSSLDFEIDGRLDLDDGAVQESWGSWLKKGFSEMIAGYQYQWIPSVDSGGSADESIELDDTRHFGQQQQFRFAFEEPGRKTPINALGEYIHKRTGISEKAMFSVLGMLSTVVLLLHRLIAGPAHGGVIAGKTVLSNGTTDFFPTTVLISLDGFHPHYISPELTPFMHELFTNGYGAPYMEPSFPSSTFPNHWTLVTGLYPGAHGVVGNTFYDPQSGEQFVNTNPALSLAEHWWGGEALWQTAALQDVSSAIHMWPGSEVPFSDPRIRPMEVDAYNGSEVLSVKVDRVLGWLDRDIAARPELVLAYVPTIDSLGHKYGIGDDLDDGLVYVDGFLQSLYDGLGDRNLTDIVNVVIVSDHGMAPTSNSRIVFLDDIVDLGRIEHIDGWPLFALRPFANDSVEDVFREMEANYASDPNNAHYDIYLKQDLPQEWHFGNIYENEYSDRLAPIWVVPKIGYSVITRADWDHKNHEYSPKGVHGYNNTEVLMRAIFLGTGPYFTEKLGPDNLKVKPFSNVEVYNIICDTLGLVPAPNNASIATESFINSTNVLSSAWRDQYDYPNVSFTHEVNIMREKTTYDVLFRDKNVEIGASSLVEGTATSSLQDSEAATGVVDPATLPSNTLITSSPVAAVPQHVETEVPDADDTDDLEDGDEDDSEETDGKAKFPESILDTIEDIMDDIEEAVDDLADSIEDKYEDFVDDQD